MTRTPTVNYIHTTGFEALASRGRLWKWMVGRVLSQARLTVCLSAKMRADVAQWVPSSAIRLIANTIADRAPARASGPPTVTFLSNLIPEKGADVFVEAACVIGASRPDVRFVVAGPAPDLEQLRELETRVELAGLASRITFEGAVGEDRKWKLLSASRMLVFPSRYPYEAQPLVIIEAFAAGVPVVAFAAGAVEDLVPRRAGFVLPVGDLPGLLEAIEELLIDDQLYSELAEGARSTFESAHSPSVFTEQWGEILRELDEVHQLD